MVNLHLHPDAPADIDGGSGGGGNGDSFAGHVGSGNTPPVSPPQGNPGGASNQTPDGYNMYGGGGGWRYWRCWRI